MEKNLIYRISVGAIFGPLIFFSAIYWEKVFFVIIFLILILSLKEFFYLLSHMNIRAHPVYGYFFGMLIFADMFFLGGKYLLLIFLFFLFSILPLPLIKKSENIFNEISWTFFGILYLSVFLPTLFIISSYVDSLDLEPLAGGKIISVILISTWLLDTFAYFIGKRFGKHGFFTSISPKKTLEGAVGGFLGAVITSVAAKFIYVGFLSIWGAVGIGVIVGIFGQLGDLVESAVKRKAKVKDASTLIPGHGGVLDRFDSLFLVSPVCYLFIKYLLFN